MDGMDANDAVEVLSSCLCCLVNSPAKYLKATYVHEGKTEIYIDMLKDCLDIRIDIDSNACGICEECVGRLRDAVNFKLQVQLCQVTLHKLITKTVWLLEEEPEVKSEIADDDNMKDSLSLRQEEEFETKPKLANDDDDVSDNLSIRQGDEDDVKPETADAAGTGGDSTGSGHVTTDHEASLTTHVKDMRHDSLGVRAEAEGGADTASGRRAKHCCDVCGKTFQFKCHLKVHNLVHTGGKPHQCHICNKRFSVRSSLTCHIRIHTKEKPYGCDICYQRFNHKGNLKNHIRTHTGEKPFSCHICNKRFRQQMHLPGHMRTHTGQKPYTCDVCNKRFSLKHNLTAHIRRHTGQKP